MARKEIQHTINGRLVGLTAENWLVLNLADKRQIVVSPDGLLVTDANNNTTTVSGTGTGVARSIAYSTDIDLTTTGSGSSMPETVLAANSTFTVAAGYTDGGNCTFTLVGDGTHSPTMSAFVSGNGYVYSSAVGSRNLYVAVYEYGSPILYGSLLDTNAAGVPVSYSTTIPLDAAESGKYMPQTVLSSNSTFTYTGQTEKGNCNFSLIGDGVHVPDFSLFLNANNYTYSAVAGANNIYSAVYAYGTPLLYGVLGTAAFTSFPTLVSATVSDSTPLRINLVWSRSMNSTVSAETAFAVSAGHVLTSHTYDTATTSHLITSTAFITGETARTLAYTIPGSNPMKDTSGNPVQSFTATTITNNVNTPTLASAIVANSTPTKIDLTWMKSMSSTVSAYTNFAVSSGHTLTAHTYVDATHTQLTTSAAFVNGETKTLSYTPNGTNDMADTAGGNKVAAFSGTAITDNVGSSGVLVRLDTNLGVNLTESGSAGAGWNYFGVATPNATNCFDPDHGAASTKSLASSTDGYIRCTLNLTAVVFDNQFIFGLFPTQSTSYPSGYALGIGADGVYVVFTQFQTQSGNGAATRTPLTGDYVRLRRSGSSIIGEVSSDSGSSWTTINTFSGASTGVLYAQVFSSARSGANLLFSDVMA